MGRKSKTCQRYRAFPKIKQLRRNAGITAEELGKAVCVSQGMISGIENGCRQSSVALIDRIAAFFGVEAPDLY